MKRHEVKDFLPILEAWKNGGQLQYNYLPHHNDCWSDVYEVALNEPPNCYRIKPTPKLRPWKPEEVPVGALIRHKSHPKDNSLILSNGAVGQIGLASLTADGVVRSDYNAVLLANEHSTDGGKTWHPCGVLEDQP